MFSLLLVRSSWWMHSRVDVILDAMAFMWRHWNDITSEQSWFASTGRHPVCHVSWGQKGTKRSATTTLSQHSIIWIILLKPTHTHHKLYSKRRSNIAFFVLTGSSVQYKRHVNLGLFVVKPLRPPEKQQNRANFTLEGLHRQNYTVRAFQIPSKELLIEFLVRICCH